MQARSTPAATAQPQRQPDVDLRGPVHRSWIDKLTERLPLLGLLVVALFAIRRLDDFDTWWHLAAGRWMVRNLSIPDTDVLSYTVPQNEWINLQWLYDVLLYGMWNIGGASGLVLLSAACFVLTFAVLSRHLGRSLGPIASTLLLGWVAMTVNERFLIRPEMASFPLLAAIQLVLASGRDDPRRLRWLVPLMVLWTNMHSLFILGVGAIGCAIAGALVAGLPLLPAGWRRDSAWSEPARKQLLLWGGIAVAATLANPYLLRGLTFPFELMSRIDGSSEVYSSIGEFRPPFSGYFLTFALGSYQAFVFTAAALAVVAAALRVTPAPRAAQPATGGPRFDVGMLAFAVALGWLSLLARRNVGIFAIGAVPFVGACLGILLERLPRLLSDVRAVRAGTIATVVAALSLCAMVVTNEWYARTGETHEFGLGIIESNFQSRATAFFREQDIPGPTYNDMTAGGYLTWDDPTGKGVYVDGRLEVYDTPFFGTYLRNLGDIDAWRADANARGIQSVMVFHRWLNRHGLIRMLISSSDWRLVYYDETVAAFVRISPENEPKIIAARTAFASTWRARTDAALTAPLPTFPWQWSIGRYTGHLSYARVLETVGDRGGAQLWFARSLDVGMPADFEIESRQRLAQYLAASGQFAQARMHLDKALEVHPDDETTLAMLAKLDAIAK